MDKKNEKLFTMPRNKLLSYVESGKDQLRVLLQLITHQLDQEIEDRWLISNLCDSYSANYKLVHELGSMIEMSSDEENNEVLMTKDDITIIEAIMIARHYTNREIGLQGTVSVLIH
tara:strand:- start:84 stop:431 length:348 start_codon:yes stop_codon:yes gene_type:complete